MSKELNYATTMGVTLCRAPPGVFMSISFDKRTGASFCNIGILSISYSFREAPGRFDLVTVEDGSGHRHAWPV